MKNLKFWALALSVMYSVFSFAQWGNGKKIKGNGDLTSVTRSVGNYDGVSVAGSMDVNLINGTEGNVVIKGESNVIEYIVTEVSKNKLIIKVEDGFNLKTTRPLTVTVPVERINLVALAGSGDINNSGTLSTDTLEVALAGSGDIALSISASDTKTKIAGSGDIRLNGDSDALNIAIAGSGDFDASGLNSQNVTVSISGSGTAKVQCNGDLKARVSGSGDVFYYGNPKTRDTKVSGSGQIKGKS
jgi:hypothetical protein